jgi:hypothetical protein
MPKITQPTIGVYQRVIVVKTGHIGITRRFMHDDWGDWYEVVFPDEWFRHDWYEAGELEPVEVRLHE